MELILSRPGVFRTFSTKWRVKWVPAIVSYSKSLKRKEISDLISNHEIDTLGETFNSCSCMNAYLTDNEAEEKLALSLLLSLFTPKKNSNLTNNLNLVYEKCLVSIDILFKAHLHQVIPFKAQYSLKYLHIHHLYTRAHVHTCTACSSSTSQ